MSEMSNKKINKLGTRIAYASSVDLVSREDLDLLQEFRKTYKDPLATTFTRLLVLVRKVDKGAIVTYRIKRINTIIRKLQRFRSSSDGEMNLSRMWDIAGCRCILSSNYEGFYDETCLWRLEK
jgi:ppGpp synthetase/RelA/SpoT-type nucleotidyltranferase